MSDPSRQCYICLDNEGTESEWVSPCRCSGSLKWVHKNCLIRWVREQEATRPWRSSACPQCRTKLKLVPEKGMVVSTLEYLDTTAYPTVKYFAGWMFAMLAFDGLCTSCGIFARAQVFGLDETLAVATEAGKIDSVVGLHLTAYSLLVISSIPWEKYLLNTLRRFSKLKAVGRIFPEEIPPRYELPWASSLSRTITSSILLPVYANVIGEVCFTSFDSKLTRVFLGGLTFVAVKGGLNMFIRQKLALRRKNMVVTPYRASIRTSVVN